MGGSNAKVAAFSMPVLIKRLGQADVSEERNLIVDLMSQVDLLLVDAKTVDIYARQLKNSDGIKVLIKITNVLFEDLDAVTYFAQILDSIKMNVDLMVDFIQFGGIALMDKAIQAHVKDNYLAVLLPKLVKVILAVGATTSVQEIEHEAVHLRLCRSCQETIERAKNRMGSVAKIEIPKSSDRVNRVLKYMKNYLPRVDVQIAGLDAIINFSRNADAQTTTLETDVVAIVAESMAKHIEDAAVIWRGCMAFGLLATYQQEVAVDIAATLIHEQMIDVFPKFDKHPLLQQQVLWLLAALTQWPRSYHILHKSAKVVEFVKNLLDQTAEKAQKELIAQSQGLTTVDDIVMEEEQIDLPLAIPVQLRKFFRDTGGKTYKKPKGTSSKDNKAKVRRNFDERPKFGTIEDRYFQKGEAGLIGGDEEESARQEDIPEWKKLLDKRDKT